MRKRIILIAAVLALLLAITGLQVGAEDQSTPIAAVATWAANEPTIDGSASESDWLIYNDITGAEGTPAGTFGKLWHGENLYLAVNTDGASSMSLTLNTSYTLTVNLSGSVTASGMDNVTVKKNGNVVELKIPFASFGFTLRNYTDTVPMALSLTNATGTSSFGGSLGFSSRKLQTNAGSATQSAQTYHTSNYGSGKDLGLESGQLGYTSTDDGNGNYTYRMWNLYQEGEENYGVQWLQSQAFTQSALASAVSGSASVDFDLNIADMPEYRAPANSASFFRRYQPAGLGVYFATASGNGEFSLSFTHLKGTGLVLYVGHGPLTDEDGTSTVQWDGPYKLNKEMGETFHVTLHCMDDHSLAVFIDDVKIYDYQDVACNFPSFSGGLNFNLWFPYYAEGYTDELVNPNGTPKSADFNSDVYVSNIQLGSLTEANLLDLLDFDTIRGTNGAEDFVNSNLTLPTTVTDGRLTSALTWTSSNTSYLSNSGVVTTGDANGDVTMTATLTGSSQSKAFALTVTRPTVDAWYSESITMDGAANEYYSFQRGYAFDGNTALAARWNDENVYLALKYTDATKLTLAIGDKTLVADLAAKTVSGVDGATVTVGSGVAEIAIPRSVFGQESQALNATITGSTTLSKALILEFFGEPKTGNVNYSATVSVDGAISETAWQLYTKTQGRKNSPQGRIGKLWTYDSLYLAVFTDDAKTMNLTVGGKSTTIDLTTLTDSGSLTTSIAKSAYTTTVDGKVKTGTLVEMRIAYTKFGFALYNYGATVPVAVELDNGVAVSGYNGNLTITNISWKGNSPTLKLDSDGKINLANQFSGNAEMYKQALRVGHIAAEETLLSNDRYAYHMWNKYYAEDPSAMGYAQYMNVSTTSDYLTAKEGTIRVDFDVRVDALEAYDTVAHAQADYGNNGLNLTLGRGIADNDLKLGISRLKTDGLVLVHHSADNAKQTTYPLNRELGEDFHISLRWEEDGDLTVYVDDEVLTTIEKAGGDHGDLTDGRISMTLLSTQDWYKAKSSAEDIDYTISNMVFGTEGAGNLMDSLTFDSFKGSNRGENNVSSDMTLPTSLTDGKLTTNLTWTSSNSAITISGSTATVNAVTVDTPVTLTATLKGSSPAVTKTFQLIVRRPALQSQLLTEGSSVTVDGTLDTTEYPSDSYYKLPYSSLSYTMASRWDKENIYIAFQSAYSYSGMPDTLVLTFGDKTATVTLSSGAVSGITGATAKSTGGSFFSDRKVEICIPLSALGIEIPEYYHNEDFTVTVEKGSTTHVTLPMRMEFCGYDSIAHEYLDSAAFDALKNSLASVTENIELPTSYTSQYVEGTADLSWESDTPRFITNTGAVTIKDKEDALVRLTVSSEGKALEVVEANVKSKYGKDLYANANIQVPFAGTINIDGAIAEHSWSINTNLTDGQSVVGKLGTAWDAENLYLAINPGTASSVTVTLEGKSAVINLSSLAVSGEMTVAAKAKGSTYLELQIPLSQFGIDKVQNYGQKLSGEVVAGNGAATLNMTLTSLQYFATDNPEHRYVMNSKSGNADLANTSHSITDSGYYFYQNYEYGSENKGGLNGYIGFHNSATAGTEIFAPMEQSGKVNLYHEMDFQAVSMPVYTGDEEIRANKLLFASNGVCWQLGGYANKAQNTSQWLAMGIYNTEGGLVLAVRTPAKTHRIPLDKQVGDLFRLGTVWMADHTVLIYVNGELIYTVDNAVITGSTVSAGGMTFQYVRSADPAVCDADSIRVNIGNIAVGNYYGEDLLDNLTFDTIKGSNTSADAISSDLTLPATLGNTQLTGSTLTWTSSNEDVISSAGVVNTDFGGSYAMVVLTVSDDYGNSKSFNLSVAGEGQCENVLYVEKDFNPAAGVGVAYSGSYFTLDTNNRSIVYKLDSVQPVNVVKLTELDSISRIYEDTLTLWYSNDNANYTQIKDFKLLHVDNVWYLYDFSVEARYIKLHSTHFDSEECLVEGFFPDMIRAYNEAVFGDNGGSFANTTSATVSNSGAKDKVDYPFALDVAELGLTTTEDIRVMLDGELLYHYVEDGKLYVRIPRVKAGSSVTLTILSGNADALDIANKEAVYEVIYGTREGGLVEASNSVTYMRIMYTLPDGTIIKMNKTGRYRTWGYSTDNGRSWVEKGSATSYTSRSSAGYHKGYAVGGFVYDQVNNVLYTYGYGMPTDTDTVTQMHMHKLDLTNGVANATWEYVGQIGKELYDKGIGISNYNHGTSLSCNDGDGPNVDMLFAVTASGESEGDPSCDRVFYTVDGGQTWLLSEAKIVFPSMQAGFEMGVSEPTTLEMDDGTVVMLCRYQAEDSISFAYSYSKDKGITWSTPVASEVYSSNTQPMFHETDDMFDLFVWAGNNQLGGTSYQRYPMNVAIPVADDDNLSVTAVQDLYSKYVWQGMSWDNSRNTNLYLTHTPDGALLIAWYMPQPDDLSYFLRVDDYKDVVLKTKGAYDSFESGSLKYEGWSVISGSAVLSDAYSTDGNYSMKMYGSVVRSLPYFRSGSVSFDVNWEAGKSFKMELQTSYNNTFGAASPVSFTVDSDGNLFFGQTDSGLDLTSGWNTVQMELDLPNAKATVAVNDGTAVDMPIHETFNEYVCYVGFQADSFVYIDNFTQIGEEAPVIDHECKAAEAVVEGRVEATCAAEGCYHNVVYCSTCGKELSRETVILEKLAHTPVVTPAVAPTCVADGLTEGEHCDVCGEVLVEQTVVPASGKHTPAITPAVAPTCTATGLTQGYHCSACGKVIVSQKVVDMVDHTEVIDPAVEPTCTVSGWTEGSHCSVCGLVMVAPTEVPASGKHTPVVTPAVAPTCTTTGLTQGYHCGACGKVIMSQKVVDMVDHTEDAYANITEETHDIACSVCGTATQTGIAHTYTDGKCACGAEEPVSGPAYDENLKLSSVSLSLQESVCMQFIYLKSKQPAGYDVSTFYLEYTQMVYNKETGSFEPETGRIEMDANSTSSYAKFTRGFVSWAMTEEITITIYGEKNGVLYKGQSYTTTVEKEAMTKFVSYKNAGNDALCKVVADMLNYGAAVQQKESYNTANLANANFTDDHRAYETTGTPAASGLTNGATGSGTINPLRVAMSLQDKVILQVLIRTSVMTTPANYEVRFAKDGNVETVIDCAELVPTSGVLRANFAVRADSMSVPYTITIHEKATGNQVSNVNTFSVVARAEELYNDATYSAQAIALVKYGNAVNAAFS